MQNVIDPINILDCEYFQLKIYFFYYSIYFTLKGNSILKLPDEYYT